MFVSSISEISIGDRLILGYVVSYHGLQISLICMANNSMGFASEIDSGDFCFGETFKVSRTIFTKDIYCDFVASMYSRPISSLLDLTSKSFMCTI